MSNNYYVYKLIDPRTNIPFYIGKGNGPRMYMHRCDALSQRNGQWINNKPHHQLIREIITSGYNIQYKKLKSNLTETASLNLEKKTIAKIGRVCEGSGPLLNISRGGQTGGETCKPVSQYTLDGEHVADYASAKIASECTIANRAYITQVCKGKRKSAGKFLWTYKGQNPSKFVKKYYRSVDQFTLDGKFISHYQSLTEAERYTNVEVHNISECCRGKSKTAGGFVWKYHEPTTIEL